MSLGERIADGSATVGVMGLGYVGLPLAGAFAQAGFTTLGFEIDPNRLQSLANGESYVEDFPSELLRNVCTQGKLSFTNDSTRLSEPDALIVCLPTPLGKAREPDLGPLTTAFSAVRSEIRPGQLIILTSTTYPGTTEELVLPALQSSGLRVGQDFFLAFSPERVDPGNRQFEPRSIPRLVAGITPPCAALAKALMDRVVAEVRLVSNCRTAEMAKLLENTFRSVNIALVNEMAIICRKLDIDVWEAIDGASTKPFGFMRFDPGPGLGGHCIPIDPAYLAWKLRMLNYRARFVELAEDINRGMPEYVAGLVVEALNDRGMSVRGARVLALGLAYKRNVGDARESPSIEVIRHLAGRGARLQIHDPHVVEPRLDGLPILKGELQEQLIREQDCLIVLTDHSVYDWQRIFKQARLVVDTRGVSRRFKVRPGQVVRL